MYNFSKFMLLVKWGICPKMGGKGRSIPMKNELDILSDERLLTDAHLFDALSYTYPGLEAAGQAVKEGRTDEAKRLIVSYFEKRRNVTHYYDYRGLPLKAVKEDEIPFSFQASLGLSRPIKEFCLYAGRKLVDEHIYVMPGSNRGEVDLGEHFSKPLHYDFINDQKKCHRGTFSIFSRGQFLEYLMVLYHEKGEQKVLDTYAEVLEFFFRTYPVVVEDFSVNAGHLMYSEDRDVMNLAWLGFVYTEMLYTQMTYELDYHLVFELLKHLLFIGMQLRRYDKDAYRPYNHHFFERGIAPYFFAVMFPEIPAFACRKEPSAAICLRHIKEDFNTEGGYNELSLGYWFGAAVSEMLYRVVSIAKLNGEQLLDADAFSRIDKTFDLFAALVVNGKFLPSIGDNQGPMIDPVLQLGSVMTGNKSSQELYDYRLGKRKDYPSLVKYYANDKTGFAIGKSGCDAKANAIIMSAKVDAGISGHNHMDMLSLITYLRGEAIVSEPYAGRLYHSVRMKSEQRGYMYDMESHNSVLCYGMPIQSWDKYANRFGVYRPDSPISAFSAYDGGMYVCAYHYGYTYCSHTRKVLFSDNGNYLVRDEVNRGDRLEDDHIQRWHFEPGVRLTVKGNDALLIEKHGVKSLWIWDNAHAIRVFSDEKLLSEFFSEEEIGPCVDVAFSSLRVRSKEQTMLVILNTLMLDVTDIPEPYDIPALKAKSGEIGSIIAEPDALSALKDIHRR